MALLHSVFAQSHHQRQIRFELFHLLPHLFTNSHNLTHRSILKVLISCNNASEALFHKLFSSIRIDVSKLVIHPDIYISVPAIDNRP
jgi:hypothetical protein